MSTNNLTKNGSSNSLQKDALKMTKQQSHESSLGTTLQSNNKKEMVREQKRLQRSKQIREQRKKSIYNNESLTIVKESETEDL